VLAAIGLGVPATGSCFRDILPNVMTTLIVLVPLMMAINMLNGIGALLPVDRRCSRRPPLGHHHPGRQEQLYTRPMVALAPGIAIGHHRARPHILGDWRCATPSNPRSKLRIRSA